MMFPTRALALIFVLAFSFVAVGCGGGMSKDEYIAEMKAFDTRADEASDAIGDPTSDPEAYEKSIEEFDELVDELDAMSPPSDIADTHDDLVDAFRDLASMLEGMSGLLGDVDTSDPEKAAAAAEKAGEFQADMTELTERVTKIGEEYEEAGYSELSGFFD